MISWRCRRRNPLEDERAVAILSYVDFAFELSTGGTGWKSDRWALSTQMQVNKNCMGKAALMSDGSLRCALSFKVWSEPSVCISVSHGIDCSKKGLRQGQVGLGVEIENVGDICYPGLASLSQTNRQERAKTVALPATEEDVHDLEGRFTNRRQKDVDAWRSGPRLL